MFRELSLSSRDLYLDLAKKMSFGLETKGILMLCNSDDALSEEYKISAMARNIGMEAVDLDPIGYNQLKQEWN
ncbi:MAG: hypothetical protein CM1200mP10_26760 [Candidatus Neomarinimicrobiota bacterium]|nr:MAG: hypothetical protein CM1200mP10_26760 [Candidatus Neomarinimicrobiota bacterium]